MKETAGQCLLHCPAYAAQCDEMLRGLEGLQPPRIITNDRLLADAVLHNQNELTVDFSINLQKLESHRFSQVAVTAEG